MDGHWLVGCEFTEGETGKEGHIWVVSYFDESGELNIKTFKNERSAENYREELTKYRHIENVYYNETLPYTLYSHGFYEVPDDWEPNPDTVWV